MTHLPGKYRLARATNTGCLRAAKVVITMNHTRIGDGYGKEGSEPHRQACGGSGSDAADDAEYEPGKAWGCARANLPAGPKIREGHEPDRRKPIAADFQHPPGSGCLFLRARAVAQPAAGRYEGTSVTGLCLRLPGNLGRSGTDQGLHADQR